ncbi:hypothetical protein N9414_10303 [Nodularia spumigena CCY9414]|jgi:hypothetical protein|nr:hypothetical protein N9414_10303 [Nodularia spumigena CCY9414]
MFYPPLAAGLEPKHNSKSQIPNLKLYGQDVVVLSFSSQASKLKMQQNKRAWKAEKLDYIVTSHESRVISFLGCIPRPSWL